MPVTNKVPATSAEAEEELNVCGCGIVHVGLYWLIKSGFYCDTTTVQSDEAKWTTEPHGQAKRNRNAEIANKRATPLVN